MGRKWDYLQIIITNTIMTQSINWLSSFEYKNITFFPYNKITEILVTKILIFTVLYPYKFSNVDGWPNGNCFTTNKQTKNQSIDQSSSQFWKIMKNKYYYNNYILEGTKFHNW